ncbi:MAG TPA: ribosome maturation factor RimM [bacterium]|nr:ribosome maturation factor RimM [bacterium]
MTEPPAYVIIGRVTRPHGIRGAVHVVPDTDFPERLTSLTEAVLLKEGQPTPVRVQSVRPHRRGLVVTLAGIESVDAAGRWRGAALAVPRAQAAPLPQGRHYVFEVLGLRVQTEAGEELGIVAQILRTGGNDVYVVRGTSRDYLIPAISSVVVAIEPAAGRMIIRPLAGLLE